MRKGALIQILVLTSAFALFSSSAAFAGSRMETVQPADAVAFDDDFWQEPEPGIAELMENAGWGASSSEMSSESVSSSELSSEPASSEEPSEPASSEESSEPASSEEPSEPVSSEEPPESVLSEESSEPVSSEEPSEPASSEESSEPVSSEEPSEPVSSEEPSEPVSSEEPSEPVSSEEPPESVSSEESVPLEDDVDEALLDAVAGAVQREIIGVGSAPVPARYEAYKAQAVAAHSYMEYHRQRTGSYPAMSYTTPHPQTVELVREVLGELIYYNGAVINAAYHAAAGGYTQSAEAVWGQYIPYLVGVESAYDDYESVYTISWWDCEEKLLAAGLAPSGDPSEWFEPDSFVLTDGGFVDTMVVCGEVLSGRTLRESVFGASNLKSCKIADITFDGESFSFLTYGFGHGVGMSQLGAIGYAENEGWDYVQILTHYYTGTEVW